MKSQSELLRALRKELAAKEKELADQKWVFEQFLKSPSWRWTAPIRWVANQVRSLRNGHTPANVAAVSEPTVHEDIVESVDQNTAAELKAELEQGTERSWGDVNPLKLMRQRK